MNKKSLLALGIVLNMGVTVPALAGGPMDPGGDAAGPQLNRVMEMLERARVEQQIEEDRKRQSAKIVDERKAETPQMAEVQFKITSVDYNKSEVLADEQIQAITAEYLNKDIMVSDLYQMLGKINNLYAEGGYVTCKAFLPPQKVTGGVVKIVLVEGKTGKVTVQGNKNTNEDYVTKRIVIPKGQVENINDLNERLMLFNGTNDAQVRVMLEAGQEPGTTDFVLQVYEPQQFSHTVFADNAGNYSSGTYRAGYFFNARSISGVRDNLTLGTIWARGMQSFSAVYSAPISHSGTQISLSYSTNATKIVDGDYEDMSKGHSTAYGVTLRQPWIVNDTTRSEVGLEYNYQSSTSDFMYGDERGNWTDDLTRDLTPYFSHTTYGKSHIFYQRHSFTALGSYRGNGFNENDVRAYKLNAYYQKSYEHGQMISARVDAQIEPKNNLPSSKEFYIGGMNSVRGYRESFLSADRGFSSSLEYAVPISKDRKHNAFAFYDYGIIGDEGETGWQDRVLQSVGLGIKSSWNKNIYSSVCIAFPLIKEFPSTEQGTVSKTRIHFLISGQM